MSYATALRDTIAQSVVGWVGYLAQENIPTGWAHVCYLDGAPEYVGPVKAENTDWIELDVLGERMTFSRDRVIVTYPL